MSQAILAHVSNASVRKDLPVLRAGFVVRVHQKIVEGDKERIQIFQGLVIKLNAGKTMTDKSFTVRKVVEGVGVEKIFPLAGSLIEKIEVLRQGKVRRSKLFYMRDLQGKSTRLQDQALEDMGFFVSAKPKKEKEEVAATEETPVAEEAPAAEEAPVAEEEAKSEGETA